MSTINGRTYTYDGGSENLCRYVGPAHSFSAADVFVLGRVYPKPGRNGDLGVARPSVKRTVNVVVNATTGERKDAILSVAGSLPVGMSDADIEALCNDMSAYLASADGKAHFKKLDINL